MSEKANSRGQRRKELEKQKKSKKTSTSGWLKRIIVACFIIGLAGLLFGGGLFAFYASSAPELDEESLKDPISSEFYDINGDVFATIGSESRDYVNYEDIPKEMEAAILQLKTYVSINIMESIFIDLVVPYLPILQVALVHKARVR